MKFLVIGLGSMGKRRIRNLKVLGFSSISGFDIRQDRLKETYDKYGINIYENFFEAVEKEKPDALIISTSPDKHMDYAFSGLELNIPCFIEASVVDNERILSLYKLNNAKGLVIAPSCTMKYYPGPQKVKELIRKNVIGQTLFINYHSGQYLSDWHPWERIEEFYVSKKATGGCREIVPFELTWMNDIWGSPSVLSSTKTKLSSINVDIDDIYTMILSYNDNFRIICSMTVDVIARPKAVRELRVLGSEGILEWSYENNYVRYSNVETKEWITYELNIGNIEKYYINPEEPYINEMKDFVSAVKKNNGNLFPNNLFEDYKILEVLKDIERKNSN